MSLFGAIISVATAVTKAVSTIGPSVANFCTKVLPAIVPALEKAGAVIKEVANVVLGVLGVFKPGEDVEDMGDRALQAADQNIKPEGFASYDEYLNEIRTFELDPEKSAKLSPVEKIGAGLAIGSVGLEKKFNVAEGSFAPLWILAASNPNYFNADRLIGLVQGGGSVLNVVRYFKGEMSPSEAIEAEAKLMNLERNISPEKADDAIYDEFDAAKNAVANLGARD